MATQADVDALGEDLAFPLALDASGDLAVVSGLDNVESALIHRCLVALGEVPIYPRDGLDSEQLLNGPGTADERLVLQARLLEQLQRDDRVITARATVDESAAGDVVATLYTQTIAGCASTSVEFRR